MSKRKFSYRIIALISCVLMMTSVLAQYAYAFTPVDTDRTDTSITIKEAYSVQDSDYPLKDVELRLWRVASVTSGAKFVYRDEWKESAVPIENLTAAEWKDAADALLAFAEAEDALKPAEMTGKTDADGKLTFDNLKVGLYLAAPVASSISSSHGLVNLERAMLISLPYKAAEADGSAWIYDVTAAPKNELKPHATTGGSSTSYTVQKRWKDKNDSSKRPERIYVRLLQDGKPFTGSDGVVALCAPSWTYTWRQLDRDSEYSVAELYIPEGYVSETKGNVITNTLHEEEKESEGLPPVRSDDTGGDKGTKVLSPKTGDEMSLALWLTLGLLAGGGLLAFLLRGARKGSSK